MNNYDWAELVLSDAHLPTGLNLCNFTRWMSAENPARYWWRNNNPLNVADFTGPTNSFGTLEEAAEATARVILQNNMAIIANALAKEAPLWVFSTAVHVSPWAAGHYFNDFYIASLPQAPIISAA